MVSISFKEILIICAIAGLLFWTRMFRDTVDQKTVQFARKLRGPENGTGFGWKGLLVAFILGMVCCCTLAVLMFRVWMLFHPGSRG